MAPSPRRPSTRVALLGLLSLEPGTGYDLKQRAQFSVGHLWTESYGQIYPTLKRLAAERLVTFKVVASDAPGKPNRVVYAITERGGQELRRWLAAAPRREPFRSELLLKVFFGDAVSADATLEHISSMREEERGLLLRYGAIEKELTQQHAGAPGLPFWLATVSYGKHRSQAVVE